MSLEEVTSRLKATEDRLELPEATREQGKLLLTEEQWLEQGKLLLTKEATPPSLHAAADNNDDDHHIRRVEKAATIVQRLLIIIINNTITQKVREITSRSLDHLVTTTSTRAHNLPRPLHHQSRAKLVEVELIEETNQKSSCQGSKGTTQQNNNHHQ
jgi:hypothetical protein